MKVAVGEQCSNKIVFKQYLHLGAMGVCQADIQRLAGLNEWIPVMMMCFKRGVPMCVHSGGIGLTAMTAHLCAIYSACVAGGRIPRGAYAEYVDELSEHYVSAPKIENGAYAPPEAAVWGFGLELKKSSLSTYEYPKGSYWSGGAQKN